jgi:serine/threonine-protein kinase RsbW
LSAGAGDETRFELVFDAVRAQLACVPALVRRAAARAELDPVAERDLRLALEEACVNVVDHGYPAGEAGRIRLSIAVEADRVVAVVADDAPTFEPSGAPAPDLESEWQERRIGGLGWHLIQSVVDEVRHSTPPEGGNRLTLIKYRNTRK